MIRGAIRIVGYFWILAALAGCAGVKQTPAISPTGATAATEPSPAVSPTLPTSVPRIPPDIILPAAAEKLPWWNDAIFYEIFVRSFYDSDGDGIGDLNGVTAKLDYLNDGDPNTDSDLGITGLWLMPIHPSPSYHGYDVTDYLAVNPQYGTLEDFKRLIDEAHRRGMRVIIDLVLNHTSSQHPWFLSAVTGPSAPYRDYYIWSQEHPPYAGPEGQNVWHKSSRGDYYYGLFWSGMPDLNYTDLAVTAEMQEVVRFWLEEVGIDGFRLDAARHLVEEGEDQLHTSATHEWWAEFRDFYKALDPDAVTVGEIWDDSERVAPYVQGDELDLAFDFDLAEAILISAGGRDVRPVRTILQRDSAAFQPGQFATFITNHDQNRAMDQLNYDTDRARMAAALLLTSPGVPFIYYGEEIGMTGVKPDEQIRTPMQWSDGENAGFTSGRPWTLINPDTDTASVAVQENDPDSLLNLYRELAQQRNRLPALRSPYSWFPETGHQGIYAVLRAAAGEAALVVINLRGEPVSEYGLSLAEGPLRGTFEIEGYPALTANPSGGFDAYQPIGELPPNAVLILPLSP